MAVPLKRLLKPRDAATLLQHLCALQGGGSLALLDENGRVYSSMDGDWALDDPPGSVIMPLELNGVEVAALALRDVPPAQAAALHFLVQKALADAQVMHEMADETLERYREINLLYRIGESIGKHLDAAAVPRLLLEEAAHALHYDVGMVLLGAGETLTVAAVTGEVAAGERLRQAADSLIRQLQTESRHFLSSATSLEDEGALSLLLCAPIMGQQMQHGIVVLGRYNHRDSVMFTAGDIKLMMALVHQAAMALETSYLHQQELQHQLLEKELAVGRQIQLSLLPPSCPGIAGWEFGAVYQAARQVGGDFYDFVPTPHGEEWLGLVIGDVTGKGIPAALFMSLGRTIVRTEARNSFSPALALQRANSIMLEDSRTRLFMTTFYAMLNTNSGELLFANGGHDYPVLIQQGQARMIEANGFVLGAFPDIQLEEHRLHLAAGDLLVLYTDGVTEARNAEDEIFGEARLLAILQQEFASAEAAAAAVLAAIDAFTGEVPRADDITLVIIRRLGA